MDDAGLRHVEAPVLVGRTDELHALAGALAHPPSVTLVEGEAGVGKTRLVREALRQPPARHRTVLTGACPPLREPFPYGPVFDLLRTLETRLPAALNPVCGALRPYLPELAGQLPPPCEPLADQRAGRHRLFRAVRALLAALGEVTVVVEDLHWADDGTRDLLRFVADDPPAGLSLVLSYRREDLPGAGLPLGRAYRRPPGTTTLLMPLQPLDVPGVRALAAALTGGREPDAGFAAALHERTAGIPFAVEELLRALPRSPHTVGGQDRADLLDAAGVPALLREAIAERTAALSPAAADAVHAAAVLRVPAGEHLLARVCGRTVDEAGTATGEALRAGVLHESGPDRYGFRHQLAQQAVYHALPGPERRRLHRSALDALAAQDRPPLIQLAYHARQAGEFGRWLRHGEAAAEAAREMGDVAVAVEALEELLSDPRLPAGERARLAVRLSQEAVVGLSHRRATGLLRRIVRDDGLPDVLRGEIRLNLGLLLSNQAGDAEGGRADTETAVEELRDRPELAARGMAALAMPLWGDHPAEVYLGWIERAESLVGPHADPALRTAVRGNHLTLRMAIGDPRARAEADRFVEEGQPPAGLRELARSCGNFADATAWLGHFEAAHRYRRAGERLAARAGATYLQGIVQGTSLRLEWNTGAWDGLADRATDMLDAVHGVAGITAEAHLVLGMLAVARGEWGEASERFAAAALADPVNAPSPVLASAAGGMVRVHLARGDHAAACAEAMRALALVRRKGVWAWAADLAPMAVAALLRNARAREAVELADEFAAGLAGRDAPLAAAASVACRAIVAAGAARHEEAAAAFEEARERYAVLPRPYSAARVAEAAVRSRIAALPGAAAGRPVPHRLAGELGAPAEEFARLGATRDAARCRRELRGSGHATPSHRGRRGYGDRLSPREAEVARLVALGHTNREIADVLFLSPRTVEQHVAKVLRKLGLTSRGDVAGPALPEGG